MNGISISIQFHQRSNKDFNAILIKWHDEILISLKKEKENFSRLHKTALHFRFDQSDQRYNTIRTATYSDYVIIWIYPSIPPEYVP